MNITLRQLKVFREVARQQSFTRASKALFLTQPAVSMQIKQLEGVIGMPLFEKQGKQINLTDAGEEIKVLSETILQQIEETTQNLELLASGQQGKLRLAVATTVASVATRLMARFNERHPALSLHFIVTNREGLIDLLETNQTDIVIMGKPPEDLQLETQEFMPNPLVVIAPPGHTLCNRQKAVSLNSLFQHNFILREPSSGTRRAIERFLAAEGRSLESSMEMNSNDAIKQSVAEGLGLGIVSIHTVTSELEQGSLKLIDVTGFPLRRSWYLVQRKGRRLSPLSERFKAYIIEEVQNFHNSLQV
ncbi:MAG: LysR family transcriptional regulator [Gammaproteobacteria bacterium]|nr:LysR family transcriptional regulator [Gammaproteobacteria bacterium]